MLPHVSWRLAAFRQPSRRPAWRALGRQQEPMADLRIAREPGLNFTGNNRFVVWEIDMSWRYRSMSGSSRTHGVGSADSDAALVQPGGPL
jgi:hypothetical protein